MANENNRVNSGKSKSSDVKVVNGKGMDKANNNAKSDAKNKASDSKNSK